MVEGTTFLVVSFCFLKQYAKNTTWHTRTDNT